MSEQPQTPADADVQEAQGLVAQYIKDYVALRAAIKELDAQAEKRKEPFIAARDKIGAAIMNFLEKTGSTAAKTPNGTCYINTRWSATLPDPEAFMNFVISQNQFDLIDRKANSTAVREYVEKNKALPPGCNLTGLKQIGVRAK